MTKELNPIDALARDNDIREMCSKFLEQIEKKHHINPASQEAEDTIIVCMQYFAENIFRDVRIRQLNLMLFREMTKLQR